MVGNPLSVVRHYRQCTLPPGSANPTADHTNGTWKLSHRGILAGGKILEPAEVADAVVRGLSAERFLILPHEEVRERIVRRRLIETSG